MEGIEFLPSVPSHHKNLLPELSGLYFVVTQAPDPRLVYLGKANNFLQRWKKHHRQPEINLLEKLGLTTDIYWLELRVTDEILSRWENQLIKDLSPVLNDTSTMAVEVKRLENKVAQLREFVIEPSSELILLPDLKSALKPFDRNREHFAENSPPDVNWKAGEGCAVLRDYIKRAVRLKFSKNKTTEMLGIDKGSKNPKYLVVSRLYDEFNSQE